MTNILESQELATKSDLAIIQRDMATKQDIAESKVEILKWVIGLMLAQTGLIIAAIKLIP